MRLFSPVSSFKHLPARQYPHLRQQHRQGESRFFAFPIPSRRPESTKIDARPAQGKLWLSTSPDSRTRSTVSENVWLSSRSTLPMKDFDVIVVGGGHAGCEAAAAAARTGAMTALVTQRYDTVGELSCNPSVGGIGKGHLVKEIDALDGIIATVSDQAGIHYRLLNRRKGPAVRGPRAQMDRDIYRDTMQHTLANYMPNLYIIEGSVQDLLLDEFHGKVSSSSPFATYSSTNAPSITSGSSQHQQTLLEKTMSEANSASRQRSRIRGVVIERKIPVDSASASEAGASASSDGTKRVVHDEICAKTVVVTTGTFLRGVLMLGHDRYAGGRHLRDSEEVEPPSLPLATTLMKLFSDDGNNGSHSMGRLKTGTPARIDGTTINWDECTIQPTDNPAQPFSHLLQFYGEQPVNIAAGRTINCYQTATNEATHDLVMKYEHTLPRYDGGLDGSGVGPRYCPSIYKKVQRFSERNSHNCFLEPEGLNTNLVYPNGMSGPFPQDIQLKILRSMRGLSQVEIVRPAYDVEYDFIQPTNLYHTMEAKICGGLYLAGQICGTTGYEEAAAQGIVAGINAGRKATTSDASSDPVPFIIGRDEGYIGVLIDDLVTKGTSEPYRMFTSRAEYRISLRADNADLRLTKKGIDFGIVRKEERIAALESRQVLIEDRIEKLQRFSLKVSEWASRGGDEAMGGTKSAKQGDRKTAEEVLAMPHVTLRDVEKVMMDVSRESLSRDDGSDNESDFDASGSKETDDPMTPTPVSVYDTVEASVKYKHYTNRQSRDMESWRKAQGLRIPPDVVYDRTTLPTLRLEEIEKLNLHRPRTFAEASQISGLNPHSLVYLYHYINGRSRKRDVLRSSSSSRFTNSTAEVETMEQEDLQAS